MRQHTALINTNRGKKPHTDVPIVKATMLHGQRDVLLDEKKCRHPYQRLNDHSKLLGNISTKERNDSTNGKDHPQGLQEIELRFHNSEEDPPHHLQDPLAVGLNKNIKE